MMVSSYVCPQCKMVYSHEEYLKDRFCPKCGTFLKIHQKPRGKKYWLFQANPYTYRIYDWWKNHPNHEDILWSIRQYSKEVRKGDLGGIWLSGQNAGIYAIVELASNPRTIERTAEEKEYWVDRKELLKPSKRAPLKYIKRLFDSPISRKYCLEDEVLSDMNILKQAQGTVFRLRKKHWDRINEITSHSERYSRV